VVEMLNLRTARFRRGECRCTGSDGSSSSSPRAVERAMHEE